MMLRGVLFFLVGPFLGRPRWSEGPRLSGCAFLIGFRTDFVTSVWVSDAFARVLALAGLRPRRGPKTPRGRPFGPLAYVRAVSLRSRIIDPYPYHAIMGSGTGGRGDRSLAIFSTFNIMPIGVAWKEYFKWSSTPPPTHTSNRRDVAPPALHANYRFSCIRFRKTSP